MVATRRRLLAGALAGIAMQPCAALAFAGSAVDVRRHGAKGNGIANDTRAVQSAIDACARMGGGTVLITAGTYLCGTVELRSHVTLQLDSGAVIRAHPDRLQYGERGALIFAKGAENIAITGQGEIDGNHPAFLEAKAGGGYIFVPTFLGIYDPEAPQPGVTTPNGRPRPVLLIDCRRVRIRDVAIRRAATWTIHLLGCDDVVVEGITIDNDLLVPNCDGIDIDHCRRVRIANCTIRAGDDGICLKTSAAFRGRGPCAEITVTGCTVTSGSTAIKLGSAGVEPIRDVLVTGCVITDSNRGLGIQNRDGSLVENISFSDCVINTRRYPAEWWGAGEPIHISSTRRKKEQANAGQVRGISFNDIRCDSEAGAYLYGEPGSSLEDIVFSGVRITVRRKTDFATGLYDLRPAWNHQEPTPGPIAAIHAEGIDGLALHDVQTTFASANDPAFASALYTRRVSRLSAEGFSGRAARPGVADRDSDVVGQ
jgi:polygalacturonase